MKLVDFKQQPDEGIADYLEGAAKLVIKFPTEEFDTGMTNCARDEQSRAPGMDRTRMSSDGGFYVYFIQ